jgi:hypothetical protein
MAAKVQPRRISFFGYRGPGVSAGGKHEPFLADVMNACLTKKAGGVSCPISYM